MGMGGKGGPLRPGAAFSSLTASLCFRYRYARCGFGGSYEFLCVENSVKRLSPIEIAYWIVTVLCALGFFASGIQNLMQNEQILAAFAELGYPSYLSFILGPCKILGAVALLVPKFPRLKEWAYAGFTFAMIGAFLSHVFHGDPATKLIGPLFLLGLVWASRLTRPSHLR